MCHGRKRTDDRQTVSGARVFTIHIISFICIQYSFCRLLAIHSCSTRSQAKLAIDRLRNFRLMWIIIYRPVCYVYHEQIVWVGAWEVWWLMRIRYNHIESRLNMIFQFNADLGSIKCRGAVCIRFVCTPRSPNTNWKLARLTLCYSFFHFRSHTDADRMSKCQHITMSHPTERELSTFLFCWILEFNYCSRSVELRTRNAISHTIQAQRTKWIALCSGLK